MWKAFEEQWNFNWVVSNPPFNQAFEILQRAFETEANIAFLLRLSFLEPTFQRQEFLAKHPPTKLIVLPRFSFTADGKTDSVTCAWMIWERNKPATSITIVTKETRS